MASSNAGILSFLSGERAAMLSALEELVNCDTPSADKQRLDRAAALLCGRFERAGCTVERLANPVGGDHLKVSVPASSAAAGAKPTLLLCHYDTVWEAGTAAAWPFRVQDDRATGPGIFDMKASIVMAEFALRAVRSLNGLTRPVTLLITSDEETGSATSRRLLEESALSSEQVLVLEPSLPGGALKTSRKGVGRFGIEIHGKAAHAGLEPEKGFSAITEMAHQILHLNSLADAPVGTTVNVGVVSGGTRSNVIPADARMEVDVRILSMAEARRLEDAIRNLKPAAEGISLTVTGGINRPPMERTPAGAALFVRAREIGRTLGLDLDEGLSGGASDGNFTAALGIPTLDGLGAVGDGAHASYEYIEVNSLVERAALLANLLIHL